jgi:hypothetical protein
VTESPYDASINRNILVDATNPGALLAEDTEARAKIAALEAQVGGLLELVVSESTRLDQTITGFVLKNDRTDRIKGDISRLQKRQCAMEEDVRLRIGDVTNAMIARLDEAFELLGNKSECAGEEICDLWKGLKHHEHVADMKRVEKAEQMLGIVPAEPVVSGSSCCNENCNGREGGACR